MRILFVGDTVGRGGKAMLFRVLAKLEGTYDFLIVNGENLTHGKGISREDYKDLLAHGVDCITLGNHWAGVMDTERYMDEMDRLVRPLNLIGYHHGKGSRLFEKNGVKIRVTNLLGTAFMKEAVNMPYLAFSELLESTSPCIHIVDYHAEATSEKQIFQQTFSGKVSAILGTHTHVPTADSHISQGGTALQCDVGMVGLKDGSIGASYESAFGRFIQGVNIPLDYDQLGLCEFNATLLEVDEKTFKAKSIQRIHLEDTIDESM